MRSRSCSVPPTDGVGAQQLVDARRAPDDQADLVVPGAGSPARSRPNMMSNGSAPGATTESTGLPDNPRAGGAWIMNGGTSAARIMTPGRCLKQPAAWLGERLPDLRYHRSSAPTVRVASLDFLGHGKKGGVVRESPFPEIAHPPKRAFLAAFRETGNVRLACEVGGVGRSSHYRWPEKDPEYRKRLNWRTRMRLTSSRRNPTGGPLKELKSPSDGTRASQGATCASTATCC